MGIQFQPLESYGRQRLANELVTDPATTSYKDKAKLAERILTDEKVNGFAVVFFGDNNEETTWGFVLDRNERSEISDMYTFMKGRGNFLFNRIAGHYQTLGWKGTFVYDDNNAAMKEFFEKAAAHPKI